MVEVRIFDVLVDMLSDYVDKLKRCYDLTEEETALMICKVKRRQKS